MSSPWVVAFLALWVMVVLLAVVVVGLLRRVGAVLESAESLIGARSDAEVALGGAPGGG